VIVVHLFAGVGHWTQRDPPRRFNDLLLRFLVEEFRGE
jgi:pimeloyl-ACP methyl ester carboxylesterase